MAEFYAFATGKLINAQPLACFQVREARMHGVVARVIVSSVPPSASSIARTANVLPAGIGGQRSSTSAACEAFQHLLWPVTIAVSIPALGGEVASQVLADLLCFTSQALALKAVVNGTF